MAKQQSGKKIDQNNQQNNCKSSNNAKDLIFDIEICQNCADHSDQHTQKESFFLNLYEEIYVLLKRQYPNCIINKNLFNQNPYSHLQNLNMYSTSNENYINFPKIGSFEVRHERCLIWSSILFKEYPEPQKLLQRIYHYLQDLIHGRDILKYSYPDSENNKNLMLNQNLSAIKNSSYIQQSIPKNIIYTQLKTQLSSMKKVKGDHSISPVKISKLKRQKSNENISNVQKENNNKEKQNYPKIRLQRSSTFLEQSKLQFLEKDNQQNDKQEYPDISFSDEDVQTVKSQNQKSLKKEDLDSFNLNKKDSNQATHTTFFTKNEYQQNNLGSKNIVFKSPKKGINSLQDFQLTLQQFLEEFKVYYVSFQYNPSFKRVSNQMYSLILDIQGKLQEYQNNYDDMQQKTEKAIEDVNKLTQAKEQLQFNNKIIKEQNQKLLQMKDQKIIEINNEIQNVYQVKIDQQEQLLKLKDEELLNLKQQLAGLNEKYENLSQKMKNQEQNYMKQQEQQLKEINEQYIQNLKIQLNKKQKECNQKVEIENKKAMELQQQLLDQQKLGFQQEAQIKQDNKDLQDMMERLNTYKENNSVIQQQKDEEIEKLKEMVENIKDIQEQIWVEKMNQNQKLMEQNIKDFEQNIQSKDLQLLRLCNFQKQMFKENDSEPILKIGTNFLNKFHSQNLHINIVVLNNLFDVDEIINEQNRNSKCKGIYIRQSEDQNIYENEIIIQFNQLAKHFKVLLIVLTSERQIFGKIQQNASIQFSQSGQVVNLIGLSGYAGRSLVVSQLFKIQNDWHLSNIEKSFEQQCIRKLINDNLDLLDLKLKLTENNIYCLKFDEQYRKKNEPIQIKCNETVPIPDLCYTSNFIISLGWKEDQFSEETTNLDSSILTFDSNGNVIDNIGVHNLRSKCKAFQHQGDVQQGKHIKINESIDKNGQQQIQQLEGEEEEIHINLNQVNPKIENFWVFFSIEDENKTFDKVEGINIKFKAGQHEFCSYKFKSVRDGVRNGCLVCDVSRVGNRWAIKGRGYFTENTRKSQDVLHIISKIRKRKLEDIKIIKLTN